MEEILVISVCLLFNALLSGIEMAFVTVPKPKLRELAHAGNVSARNLLLLRENPERTLSVIQIGITLVGAIAAAVGGAGAEESISPILQAHFHINQSRAEFLSIIIVVLPLTYLSVVLGELVPKTLALRKPVTISLKAAGWLALTDKLLSPVVSILEGSTKIFLKVFFRRSKSEITWYAGDTVELDQLSQQARQYVVNVVNIEKKKVRDVLLPWEQVIAARYGDSFEAVEAVIAASGHTRVPVLHGDKATGIINTKEFTALKVAGKTNWESIVRPAVQVQGQDSLLKALRLMQEKRSHLSIVYDQTRRVGIVTMEDVIEEIIGDVFDEDDDGALKKILSTGSTFRTTTSPTFRN